MSDPPPPGIELEDETHVTSDVPCVGCGYNLRTLATDGECPECGKPVATSISLVGLRQWPLNAEFACDKLGFGAAVIVFVGIGAILWIIGSLQLASRLGSGDPYAAALRRTTELTAIALPISTLSILILGYDNVTAPPFFLILITHYLTVHLIGVRLCKDLELLKQRLMCWALVSFCIGTLLLLLLISIYQSLLVNLKGEPLIFLFLGFCFAWFILLITTWAWISSDIGKRRNIIEGRHLSRLGKTNRHKAFF